MSTDMSIFLVREYDYELQEVRFVAATQASAQTFVEGIRTWPCTHSADFHGEDWPVSDCVQMARHNAERLQIEEWAPDATAPVRLCCPRPGCLFTVGTKPPVPGDPIFQHVYEVHRDLNPEA